MFTKRMLRKIALPALAMFVAAAQLSATTIQLDPTVGRRGVGLYRAPSYLRTQDQYAQQAQEDYNFKLGNMHISLAMSLETEYDDNVNRSEDDEEDGLSLTPALHTNVYWPINPGFQIHSGITIGYKQYISGGDEADDEGVIVEGTDGAINAQIGADMRIGDSSVISVSEEFVRTMDSFQTGPDDGEDYTQNRNLINLQYRNQFSELTSGTVKFTHTNQWADDDDFEQRDHYSDFIDIAFLRAINNYVSVGPYARAGMYRYTEDMHNDSEEIEGGLAISYSRHARFGLSGSVGYSKVMFDDDNNPAADDEYSGLTTQVAARYSHSEFTTHRLVLTYGGEQGTVDADANYVEEMMAQYTITVLVHEDVILNGDAGYINGDESDAGEEYDLYRFGIGVGYRFTRDTTMDLRYHHEWKDSDIGNEYDQNVVTLRLVHQF